MHAKSHAYDQLSVNGCFILETALGYLCSGLPWPLVEALLTLVSCDRLRAIQDRRRPAYAPAWEGESEPRVRAGIGKLRPFDRVGARACGFTASLAWGPAAFPAFSVAGPSQGKPPSELGFSGVLRMPPKPAGRHWGTTPGQNFIYVHLNRVIEEYEMRQPQVRAPRLAQTVWKAPQAETPVCRQ